jgi:hypothetical protein
VTNGGIFKILFSFETKLYSNKTLGNAGASQNWGSMCSDAAKTVKTELTDFPSNF